MHATFGPAELGTTDSRESRLDVKLEVSHVSHVSGPT
jgi:hypothetical protein